MSFIPKTPEKQSSGGGGGKRVTTAVMASVMAFAYMCSKQASRVRNKLKPAPAKPTLVLGGGGHGRVPQSPRTTTMMIQKPKQLFATISNKAITLVHSKKKSKSSDADRDGDDGDFNWGHGGVWQRSILMGDKCQPLDFSGVIYYDSHGKQTSDLPIRSPRASPLPSYLHKTQHDY